MRTYHVNYINKNGEEHLTWGECKKEGTEATKERLTEWAAKWGHTILFDTYREEETDPNPAFVEACVNDFKAVQK